MKEVNIRAQVVGKDSTRGLQTPRFRLFSGETNAKDIEVFHYGIISKDVDEMPDIEVTNVYKVVDVLNECIDDYHERHKED